MGWEISILLKRSLGGVLMPLQSRSENHFTVLQVCTKCWGTPCCSLCVGGDFGSEALKLEKLTVGIGAFQENGGRRFTVCMETSESQWFMPQWSWDEAAETQSQKDGSG